MKIRRSALFLLLVAAICLIAAILPDVSPQRRNLLVVAALTFAVCALASIKAGEGPFPSGLPMIVFGVLMIAIGPPLSQWIYGDALASVLRLEYPLRPGRLLVHSGYALVLAGLLLVAYSGVKRSALGARTVNAPTVDEGSRPSPFRKSLRMMAFQLKAGLLVALALLAIISVMTYLGIF